MAYGGINVHKKQSQMCLLTEAGARLPQRIPTPRGQCAAVCAKRPTAHIVREASTESAWVARKCTRPFHWCWTGAAAWGRVAPLGWLQGDGRETGGCGRLGGKAGGPRVRRHPENGHAQAPRKEPQPSRRHVTALPARRVPGRAASGRQDRGDRRPRRGRAAGQAQREGRDARRQSAHRPVDRNTGRGARPR